MPPPRTSACGTGSSRRSSTLGADHLHGADRLLPVEHAQADAEDQAAGDQARLRRPSIGWDEVAGADEAKAELQEVVDFLRDPERFQRSAPRSRRASCCTARPAPARRCWPRRSRTSPGASFYSQSAASFVEMFAGLGAARIRRLFKEARENRAGDRVHRRDRRRRRRARLGQQLRARADAQPAARRDGRLRLHRRPRRDRRVQPAREARPRAAAPGPLRPPDLRLAARRHRPRGDPARAHARQAARADVDLEIVARQTAGLAGADLANICNEAAIFAAREHRRGSARSTSRPRWSA